MSMYDRSLSNPDAKTKREPRLYGNKSSSSQREKNPAWLGPICCVCWFGGLLSLCFMPALGGILLFGAFICMAIDKNLGSAL